MTQSKRMRYNLANGRSYDQAPFIFVNGKKRAALGEGYTSITLPEGDYEIIVEKRTKDGDWIFRGVKTVFVGADTSTGINIKTEKFPSEKKES